MRRIFLFLIGFMLAFNTVSLSAYASACPHGPGYGAQNEQAEDAIPCHETGVQKQAGSHKTDQTPGHCAGVCFCLHAAFGPVAALVRTSDFLADLPFMKNLIPPAGPDRFATRLAVPLERPPKNFS